MSSQASILIIYTGGTSDVSGKKNKPLQLLNFDNIYDQHPFCASSSVTLIPMRLIL
jgi:hypothetical protein